jgi:pimeloyl-ACP methyl ester carboxylesterase
MIFCREVTRAKVLQATARESDRTKAPGVLVHGAWHGGWCWKKLRPLLEQAGHPVFTPTLTGLGDRRHLLNPTIGLRTHVEDVCNLLELEDLSDVVLVGHSYAGMVVSGVAAAVPQRIDRLVYLDAFLPQDGKSLNDYVPAMVPGYERSVAATGDGWRLPFAGALTLEALGITEPADIAWMEPRMGDQPYRTFIDPVAAPERTLGKLERVYILSSSRPHYLAAAERARALGFSIVNVPGAGHDVMVTRPAELAGALLRLAAPVI